MYESDYYCISRDISRNVKPVCLLTTVSLQADRPQSLRSLRIRVREPASPSPAHPRALVRHYVVWQAYMWRSASAGGFGSTVNIDVTRRSCFFHCEDKSPFYRRRPLCLVQSQNQTFGVYAPQTEQAITLCHNVHELCIFIGYYAPIFIYFNFILL